MIYNTVSSKEIVAKVITDLRLGDYDYHISDIREWILEGLESIGAFRQFDIKVTGKEDEPLLAVEGYQAKLPEDLHKPVIIQYSKYQGGPYTTLKWNTNPTSFRNPTNKVTSDTTVTPATADTITLTMSLLDLNYDSALELLNSDHNFNDKIKSLLVAMGDPVDQAMMNGSAYDTSVKYTINSNYIKLNVRDGYIRMVYSAMPLDEDNYPLVPDLQSFRDALYWYVAVKLYYPDWVSGKIRDRVFEHAESKWRFFSQQAYAEGIMPDIAQLESMKDQWLRLIPDITAFDNSFTSLSEPERYNVNT